MSSFDSAITTVLLHEGGFVNDPHDPGGATNYGVSLRWLQSLGDDDKDGYLDGDFDKNNEVDAADIKNLNLKEAMDLYKKHWWDKYGYEEIQDQALATKVFDFAVNAGPKKTAGKLIPPVGTQTECTGGYHDDSFELEAGLLFPARAGRVRPGQAAGRGSLSGFG